MSILNVQQPPELNNCVRWSAKQIWFFFFFLLTPTALAVRNCVCHTFEDCRSEQGPSGGCYRRGWARWGWESHTRIRGTHPDGCETSSGSSAGKTWGNREEHILLLNDQVAFFIIIITKVEHPCFHLSNLAIWKTCSELIPCQIAEGLFVLRLCFGLLPCY